MSNEDEHLALLEIISLVTTEIEWIKMRLDSIEAALDLEYDKARDE